MTKESWRDHPRLQGRFHPDAPDDVQVLVHDGGPRLTDRRPEVVWVTVIGCDDSDLFTGRVLNNPQHLVTASEGDEIKFIAPSGEHLLMVTDKYLIERLNWRIQACQQCGLDELLDAPSDLLPVIFPNMADDETVEMFTSYCGVCGGIQVVADIDVDLVNKVDTKREKRSWWRFWK